MSDDPKPPEDQTDQAAQTGALAKSVPDPNTVVAGLIKLLLAIRGLGAVIALPGAVLAILFVIVAIVGVPAMLAAQSLVDKLLSYRQAQNAAHLEALKASASPANQQILDGIHGIDTKLDSQGKRIDQLGSDVRELRGRQATTDAKVRALAAERAGH